MGMMETLLDQDISTIADLPTFNPPPKGAYKLLIKKVEADRMIEIEKVEYPAVSVQYSILQIVELANPEDASKVKVTDEFNETFLFMKDTEKTKSAIKTCFKGVGEKLGITNLMAIINKLEGMEVYALVTQRKDKKDPDRVYANVSNVTPA